jgi:multidrug efflux pump subunit AcrA (membrane-fusion protein)
MQGAEIRTAQVAMKVKAARLRLEKTLIKGDSTSNVNEFDGLQARIPSGSSQLITNAANGGGLSLAALDELIDAVDETVGSPVLVMNRGLRRRLSAAARVASAVGNLTYGQDALGRQQYSYNGVPIIDIDHDETGTAIMPFSETQGSSSACSSVYCVAAGANGATLITNGGIQVRDLGEIDSKPVRRIRVEAYLGMAVFHPRAIARLAGVTDAAVGA